MAGGLRLVPLASDKGSEGKTRMGKTKLKDTDASRPFPHSFEGLCGRCGKTFASPEALRAHLRAHAKSRRNPGSSGPKPKVTKLKPADPRNPMQQNEDMVPLDG